jgi:hypothetical protein
MAAARRNSFGLPGVRRRPKIRPDALSVWLIAHLSCSEREAPQVERAAGYSM